jgi:hypothetical protein
MKLTFDVDGTAVEFARNCFTGRSTLTANGERTVLQSPLNPFTHFSMQPRQRWQCTVNGKAIVIEKQRPVLLAGFRPQTYRIFVDGNLVVERTGF